MEAVTSADELSIFSEWDGIVYRDIKDNNIKGVGSDGLLARLSVDDVMALPKRLHPLYWSARRKQRLLSFGENRQLEKSTIWMRIRRALRIM